MKKEEMNGNSPNSHSIDAILGILPTKRTPSKIPKSLVPYPERKDGKNDVQLSIAKLAVNSTVQFIIAMTVVQIW